MTNISLAGSSTLTAVGQDALAATGGIDRITYADYTVAVKSLDKLLVSYIFHGQSYLALQKLDQFLTRLQETPTIYQALGIATPPDAPSKAIGALAAPVQTELNTLIRVMDVPLIVDEQDPKRETIG